MSTIVQMPQLGESVAEGTIGRWLKQPGDRVERDEPLVEVQTDKVNAEVPSPVAGILQRILQPEGTTVAVKTDIAVIGDEALVSEDAPQAQGPEGTTAERTPAEAAAASPPPLTKPPTFSYDNTPGGGPTSSARVGAEEAGDSDPARQFLTPVVMRMVQEHGLDIADIQGSGRGGRVTRKDVERTLEQGSAPPKASQETTQQAAVPPPTGATTSATPQAARGGGLTPMRRAIAEHMTRARAEIPDAWSMVEIDVTPLVRRRAAVLDEWQARQGFELTFLPFFIKAVLAGLRAVPELNATWTGDAITVHRTYDLGIAVSVDDGLVVPVLRGADQMSVTGIAHALRDIVGRARGGKLGPADLQGGTFTVNNPGSLGSILSQPIVPLGQAAIVTMEAIVKRPVVIADDAIAVRSMMNACLSFDHRIMDGAQALRFLRTLKQQLETVEYPVY